MIDDKTPKEKVDDEIAVQQLARERIQNNQKKGSKTGTVLDVAGKVFNKLEKL